MFLTHTRTVLWSWLIPELFYDHDSYQTCVLWFWLIRQHLYFSAHIRASTISTCNEHSAVVVIPQMVVSVNRELEVFTLLMCTILSDTTKTIMALSTYTTVPCQRLIVILMEVINHLETILLEQVKCSCNNTWCDMPRGVVIIVMYTMCCVLRLEKIQTNDSAVLRRWGTLLPPCPPQQVADNDIYEGSCKLVMTFFLSR